MSLQELLDLDANLANHQEELVKAREQLGGKQQDTPEHDLENPPAIDHAKVKACLEEVSKVKEAKQPGEKEGAPKSPPKGYPESRDQYADPTNFKYPLDTEKHVRAALSYFSQHKGSYSPEEQKFMWRRIMAASKKYGVDLSDDVKKAAEMVGAPDEGGETGMTDGDDGKKKDGTQLTDGDVEAFRKVVSEWKEFKGKHEEEGKKRREEEEEKKTKEAKLEERIKSIEGKLTEQAKATEAKLKEMSANANAGAVVAKLDQMFGKDGALPSGHEGNDSTATPSSRTFGEAMEKAAKPKPRA